MSKTQIPEGGSGADAIDASKINKELGWEAKTSFEEGLLETVNSFINNF